MLTHHGEHAYNGVPGNSGIGNGGGNRGPPTVSYQSYASNSSQSPGLSYYGPQPQGFHQTTTPSPWPAPIPQTPTFRTPIASPGHSTQAFTTPQPPFRSQQAAPLQIPSGSNQPSLAPFHLGGHMLTPPDPNQVHPVMAETEAACCLPTPGQTPTPTPESSHTYPHYDPDLDISHWAQQTDPQIRLQSHTSNEAMDFPAGAIYNGGTLPNAHCEQQFFHGFAPGNIAGFANSTFDRGQCLSLPAAAKA